MRHPGGPPQKNKIGPREMNSKMVVVVDGPALTKAGHDVDFGGV